MSEFRTSESTAKIDAAMAKAQSQIEAASKDKVNPAFRSKYADLAAVWEACRKALTDNGISITQWPTHSGDNRLHLITRLACEGEWMLCEFSIPTSKQDAHGYGSAVTYAKRFALAAAVGVVADDDDDGNAASGRPANGQSKPTAAAKPPANHGEAQGPLPITKLKDAIRLFSDDLARCSDADELNGLLTSSRGILEQCERDLPGWYFTKEGSDVTGVKDRIATKQQQLAQVAA